MKGMTLDKLMIDSEKQKLIILAKKKKKEKDKEKNAIKFFRKWTVHIEIVRDDKV